MEEVTTPAKPTSAVTPPPTPVPNPDPPVVKKDNKKIILVIIGVIVLITIFSGLIFYFVAKARLTTTTNKAPATAIPQTSLFSGTLTRLNQNLEIFKSTENDKLNGIENNFTYYEAGKFLKGELKDYFRVVAIRPSQGPGISSAFILATKDYQKYILDDPEGLTSKYAEDDYQNPYSVLDKSKIISSKKFDTEQAKEIDLNNNYSLYFEQLPVESVQTSKLDKNGNVIYDTPLTTDFSTYQKLASPISNLTIYSKPYQQNRMNINQLTQAEKDKEDLKQKYFLAGTEVVVVDSVGLPMTYSLTNADSIKAYVTNIAQYQIDLKNYQEQLKQNIQTAQSPNYVYLPNMGFKSSQINNQKNLTFYKDYEIAIPDACAFTLNSRIINVSESDLEQIGTIYNVALYRLKDSNHPLYNLAYKNKLDYYDQDPSIWDQVNKGVKKPTLEEYVSLNPLLFVKDYWQRFVGLGEYDIKLPGGCGKPVVYLYPEKPTEVAVKFMAPIEFSVDIPKYGDFWQVVAYPDGSLVNLKANLTDCQLIDETKLGLEYAKEACSKNIYPYLYWAGNIHSKDYPTVDKGWIVERNKLSEFLNSKLTEVGFSNKEKNDFLNYWLKQMQSKNAAYYRISFLQTNDLNLLFPMAVNPQPDTVFRLFLDYLPLNEKPLELPEAQVLNKLVRHGFTLVEWGGLKQP